MASNYSLIALIISDIDHLFMYLLTTCILSLQKCLFNFLAHFLIKFFFSLLVLSCRSSLFVPDIISLSGTFFLIFIFLFKYLQYFLQFHRLSFHSANNVLCIDVLCSLIYVFFFCHLDCWYHIQETISKSRAMKLSSHVFL